MVTLQGNPLKERNILGVVGGRYIFGYERENLLPHAFVDGQPRGVQVSEMQNHGRAALIGVGFGTVTGELVLCGQRIEAGTRVNRDTVRVTSAGKLRHHAGGLTVDTDVVALVGELIPLVPRAEM